jgi:wyosine [tRNA(Phe)-imidazoG37] synthetase (radical SAM superfamily)
MENLIFGPVPSRRLGKSIGINNIPHKTCSYSCVYCQIGKAVKMQIQRAEFYQTDLIITQIEKKLQHLSVGELPDYLTLVPDGEPCLDIRLEELIIRLKKLGFPVAVITNSSLITQKEVQDALMHADYVSFKIDSTVESTWKKIDNPHKNLNINDILNSIRDFSFRYTGKLVTESMLIQSLNDSDKELKLTAEFLKTIRLSIAYISIPTRPPAYENVCPADESRVAAAYKIFTQNGIATEYLTGYEGNAFAASGNFTDDILSITSVHPMREDAVLKLLKNSDEPEKTLNELIENGFLTKVSFMQQNYFLRKFRKN